MAWIDDAVGVDQLSRRRAGTSQAALPATAPTTIRNAMTLINLANPTRFLSLTARILPWLAAATAILLTVGLTQSVLAPDDYHQGATVKIMFIHVPNAWLSMFVWGALSLCALATMESALPLDALTPIRAP